MSRWPIAGRGAVMVLGVGAGATLAGVELDLYDLSGWPAYTLIGALAGTTVAEQVRAIVRDQRAPRREEFSRAMQETLIKVALEVHEATGYRVRCVGASAFRVADDELDRVGRQRFNDHPQPSPVKWTKGKGIIGICWADEKTTYRDLRPLVRKYGDKEITEAVWANVSKDARMGLTRKDFAMMIGKYAEVLAVPIKDEAGEFLGCISIDVPVEECSDSSQLGRLDRGEVKEVASSAARVVRGLLLKGG